MDTNTQNGIAIIGMSGRFPKAKNVREFWKNICNGVDCISTYTDDELRRYGISESILADERYVKAKGEMEEIDMFDAQFFGYTPAEAKLMDPQHRKFLECCWEAMEDAGYNVESTDVRIGVFAGESLSTYMIFNVLPNINTDAASAASLQAAIGNDKDSLTTTVTYKMNLRGAGVTIQSSSSTSLTAIVMACQSLLNYQNDMILAGGVSIGSLQKCGYLYEEQGILSPNGKCCPYDQQGNGFVPGTGVGVVVLKRLNEAIEDGDHIYAVIQGFDLNNDGARKVSYSAPSVAAQTEVILGAQQFADFDPHTITYVEGHGTATKIVDVIETKALKEAFCDVKENNHCVLGSVKGNIGHLDAAAGVTSLIKASLSVEKGMIPPTINFTENNKELKLEDSPFYVSKELIYWNEESKRRAGVSSFGMGGTNAHIVIEEYKNDKEEDQEAHKYKIILLSAQNEDSLHKLKTNIDEFLNENDINLSNLAYTSQIGRKHFNKRQAFVCTNADEFVHNYMNISGECKGKKTPIVFMFPGQGAQFFHMGKVLYQEEQEFQLAVDECVEKANGYVEFDIRNLLFGAEENIEMIQNNTASVQILLFVIEYAIAKTLIFYHILPDVMIGHSVGEYVAACIAGAISLSDAIYLIVKRGSLMERMNEGIMVSVFLNEEKTKSVIQGFESVSIAAVNDRKSTVISGNISDMKAILQKLENENIIYCKLRNKHAFHSKAVEDIKEEFLDAMKKIQFHKVRIPVISNVNGKLVEEFSKRYFIKHLESTVRFMEGIQTINKMYCDAVYLEIGPGCTLSTFVKRIVGSDCEVHTSLSNREPTKDGEVFYQLMASLWVRGTDIDWRSMYKNEKRKRISYPTYVFKKESYWLNSHIISCSYNLIDEEGKTNVKKSLNPTDESFTESWRENISAKYVKPNNEIQSELCQIWESMLEMYPIGVQDNFFELGADSLTVTQLFSRIYKKYKVHVEYKLFFSDPTILMLSNIIDKKDAYAENDVEELLKETSSMSDIEIDELIKILEQ